MVPADLNGLSFSLYSPQAADGCRIRPLRPPRGQYVGLSSMKAVRMTLRMLLDDGRLGLIDFGLVAQMTEIHQELTRWSRNEPKRRRAWHPRS